MKFCLFLFYAVLLGLPLTTARANVLISEIMYHPQSENPAEEYIELHNAGADPIDLGGWKITSGVRITVPPATTIPSGGYLVVAADAAAFAKKYPGVTNFVAGWTGQLSNSADTIRLEDVRGVRIDEVGYADDGDWAQRRRQDSPDHGHRGWVWRSDADGHGKSLELINPLFDNEVTQNWTASTVTEGTPGAVNSVKADDIAPVISEVMHFPLVPKSAENVTISCRVRDEEVAAEVAVFYRVEGATFFTRTPMLDDGMHDDALAGDGVFGAVLPPQPDGSLVEFYIRAEDARQLSRTWPAPAREESGILVQSQNCLYQVDNSSYAGTMPLYRIILRAADRTELSNINTDTGTPPFPFNPGEPADQTHSHARFNATFISQDGTGAKVRYLTGVRNRGNGSRELQPQSFSVQFANADTWNGISALNLNTQNTPWQLLGSAVFRKAGLATPESRAVQVRVNGTNLASGTGAPSYGFYVCNEVQNSDFADHHFPLDSSGNIYRAQRLFEGTTSGGTTLSGATLEKIIPGANETLSLVELYKLNYRKETNNSEDDWNDLIALTEALSKGHSGATANDPVAWDADYVSSVKEKVDVAQWMRWFAVQVFADNEETNLANGDGDDYYLYLGQNDARAKLVPFDLDTILGGSSTSNVATHGIFRMIDSPGTSIPVPVNPFIKHPDLVPLYYSELKRLSDETFLPANFDPLVDTVLSSVAPASVLTTIKSFNAARHAHIATLVPLAISVTASQTNAGAGLSVVSGYPQTTNSSCKLIGKAHAIETRSIKVNGVAATWSAWQAQWTADGVALVPGVNRILIQAFDRDGNEVQRGYHSVWYNDASEAAYSGTLGASTTWSAAGGPYRVTGSLTVPSGVTLTIQPGAVVMLNSGVNVTVASGGRLLAEGTEVQPIRFMAAPGVTSWGGITINGGAGTPESRIAYAFIEGNGSTRAIDVNGGDVVLDHLQFGNTTKQYISLDGASFIVSHCVFPTATAGFELVHGTLGIKSGGRGIIRDCFFGRAQGYNDVIDFTGGNRPGPILQVINNVFIGSDDDLVDIDGTDCWVEGNIFMHVHRNGSPDSASAVSGGDDSGDTSEVTIIGNLFYDMDQAVTAKLGNFYTLLNNTIIDQNQRGSEDAESGVINLADEGTAHGAGMYLEGNVIHSAMALARNYNAAAPLSVVTMNNNLLPFAWTGPGSGNTVADPQLNNTFDVQTPDEGNFERVAAHLRAQFGLQNCSLGIGTGPNGTDKGGVRPLGVSLAGVPRGITNETGATITVGSLVTGYGIPSAADTFPLGSGWTHYKWRLDDGAWSSEKPIGELITLAELSGGLHVIEVVGKNDAGYYQNDPDFGRSARITRAEWTIDRDFLPPPGTPQVRINEVLALNTETRLFGSAAPDMIELYNAGNAVADISGWGLTDNTTTPFKYLIPAGTTLAPGSYLVIYASGSGSVPQPKSGFGLKREGDTLTLTRSAAAGGGIADSVPFGYQLADYSIGRCQDASWALCRPTFGAENVLAATGPVKAVRINEWLADAAVLAGEDFIELMNTSTLPVSVGQCFLTDNPVGRPAHHQIRQLTFIAPGGYLSLKADDDADQGPDHLRFKLDALQGEIALFDPSLVLVDNVVFGPQSTDISQGRTPNGASRIGFFTQPTPGGPNPSVVASTTTVQGLMAANHEWRFSPGVAAAPANDMLGNAFIAPAYDDSSWQPGGGTAAQLFYIETNALTNSEGFAKTTVLPGLTTSKPYQTYYFRTRFNYSGPLTGVTLSAKMMVDDGAVIYLNGVEAGRVGMAGGAVSWATLSNRSVDNATVETVTLSAAALVNGDNVIAVEVHQTGTQSAATGSSSDVVWGMKLEATLTIPGIPVILNEVLSSNGGLENPDGSYAGWVELHNPSASEFDLSDMSLSNNPKQPRRYVFAPGTKIPAGGYLVVQCSGSAAASETNTGFSLSTAGGVLALYHTVANDGGLHDSVAYGRQIADFSIGREPEGSGPWALCVPSRSARNTAAALGSLTDVRINEWLALKADSADFLELFNTGSKPVAIGGCFLTDDLANRTKSPIPELSFIGGSGNARWQRWIADGASGDTPEHVTFELAATGEGIGLYTATGFALDKVSFGAQLPGFSSGRYPDGGSSIYFSISTPAAANQLAVTLDTDGDNLPDIWELTNGLNPSSAADGALIADADGDGQSNLAEYISGTNPQNAMDALRSQLAFSGDVSAVVFTAVAGKTYTVQYTASLTDPTWVKLADVPAASETTEVRVQDTTSSGQSQRFYRVVTPAVP